MVDESGVRPPGARLVEVVPPGSSVGLVLLPPGSEIPIAVRRGTTDAGAAHARIREAGVVLDDDEVLHLEGARPQSVRPRQVSVPRRCPATDRASSRSKVSSDTGWASASGHTRLPVAAALTARPATPAA